MIKLNRRYFPIVFTIAVLVVIASVCRDLNVNAILRSTTGIFLGLTRSTIYIGLFSAWGFSVRHRIVSKNIRRLLTAESGLLVLWMLIRTVKYYFVADPNVNRMLWYLYYFMLCESNPQPVLAMKSPPILVPTMKSTGIFSESR